MRMALPKLKRRLGELEAFDPNSVNERSDPRIDVLRKKIDDTLVEIFGNHTADYMRYRLHELDTADHNYLHPTPLPEVRNGLRRGVADAIATLTAILDLFSEKLTDQAETPASRARRAFDSLNLHREVARAVAKLFRDGHYANAVEDACKVLDGLVRIRSGRVDGSGTSLMQTVFSANSPVLRFSALKTETEKSEQQGMMSLYAGVMLAFRNPRAHEIVKDDPEMALEIIGFISHLARALDRAERS
jgi:uncharacterized protein (TIGR02391 family)